MTKSSPPPELLWRDVVGEQLRKRRRHRGDTLQQVARWAGVSPPYLSEMERGRNEPSSEMLAAVAGALDLSLLDLTLGAARRLGEMSSGADAPKNVQSAFMLAA